MNYLRLRSSSIALMLLLALSAPASAQDVDEMRARAVTAMTWAMNRANNAADAFSISYGGQPGDPGTKQGRLTGDYFVHEADYVFQLRSERSPREAIRRVFYPRPAESVELECNTMMVAIEYWAIGAAIRGHRFERAFGGQDGARSLRLEIGQALSPRVLGGLLVEIANPTEDDLQPGDWVYFANNPNYLLKHSNGPWQGENAIYVGDNAAGEKLYSGFGVHEHTAAQMAASMMRAYNAEPSAASRAPERRRAAWFADPANTSSLHVSEAKAHERLAEVARDLQLDPNEIDWDVSEIQDGIWELYLDYTPPSYPETITIDEVRGLVQCLRIDVDALANLCREIDADQPLTYAPAPASPVTATASAGAATGVGLAGVLGGLGN